MARPPVAPSAAPRRPPRLRLLPLALAAGGALAGFLLLGRLASPPPLEEATLGFAWPEFRQTAMVRNAARLTELARALARARRSPGLLPDHLLYWRLSWRRAGHSPGGVLVTRNLEVGDPATRTLLAGRELRAFLARETAALARATFGVPLPWPEVDRLWPWDGAAVIRDVETGASFRVLRYGGYDHADAEPATARDAVVLKSLYGGRWSWRRRAVVVELAGRRIAASINGMPHGEGVVPGNAFPGHFCVHFAGSTTHGSGRADPAHGLMILKASGRLADALDAAPPARVAELALVAAFQRDAAALRHAADRVDPAIREALFAALKHLEINSVRLVQGGADGADRADPGIPSRRSAASRGPVASRPTVVEADVTVYAQPDPDRARRERLRLRLLRIPGVPGWKVRFADLAGLLAPGTSGRGPAGNPTAPSKMGLGACRHGR